MSREVNVAHVYEEVWFEVDQGHRYKAVLQPNGSLLLEAQGPKCVISIRESVSVAVVSMAETPSGKIYSPHS